MRSADLTAEQIRRLLRSLKPKLAYLGKLRSRMEQTGFPEHDRVLRDARIAEKVLSDLLMELETLASYKGKLSDPFR